MSILACTLVVSGAQSGLKVNQTVPISVTGCGKAAKVKIKKYKAKHSKKGRK
jgi:hypothetical protein